MSYANEEWSDVTCDACGALTEADLVNVTLWPSGHLVLVEDVPAQVCRNCDQRYFDPEVGAQIQKLVMSGFPGHAAVRQISVPVFASPSAASPKAASGSGG